MDWILGLSVMALMDMKDQEGALLDAYLNVDKGQETAEALMTKASSSQENFITRFYDSLLSKSGGISKQDLPPVSTQPAIQVDPAEIEEFMQIYNNSVMQQMYDNDMGGLGSDAPDPLGNMGVPPARLVPVDDLGLDNPEPLFKLFDDIKNENIKKEELPDILGSMLGAGLRRRDSSFVGGDYRTAGINFVDPKTGEKIEAPESNTVDLTPPEAGDQDLIPSKSKGVSFVDLDSGKKMSSEEYKAAVKTDDATQSLLDRIAWGEGAEPVKLATQEKHGIGTTPYDMVYDYGNTLAPSKPVSEMTLKELYDFQTKLIAATKGKVKGTDKGTSAVGKYQVVRTSLFGEGGTAEKPSKNSWANKLNLKADTIYTPEIQEKIGMLALTEAGYNTFIRGKRSRNSFHNKIANIWASVAKADGSDKYGQGIHTVLTDLQPMYDLLKPIKSESREYSPRPKLRPKGLMEK